MSDTNARLMLALALGTLLWCLVYLYWPQREVQAMPPALILGATPTAIVTYTCVPGATPCMPGPCP